jgi:hypothetical protein
MIWHSGLNIPMLEALAKLERQLLAHLTGSRRMAVWCLERLFGAIMLENDL